MYTGTSDYFFNIGRDLQILEVSCSGSEFRLSDCGYTIYEMANCSYRDYYGASCNLGIYIMLEVAKQQVYIMSVSCVLHTFLMYRDHHTSNLYYIQVNSLNYKDIYMDCRKNTENKLGCWFA